jgi:alkylation response protein AidB-like acyl-CoA dehydrogenase
MADYVAPLADMRFVIERLTPLADIARLEGFEDATPDLVESVLEGAAQLATAVLSPLNWTGYQVGATHTGEGVRTAPGWQAAYRQFVDGGWNGLSCAPAFGGQGLPKVVATAVNEMWNSANLSFALAPMLTQGAIEAIEHHGTDAQRAAYLPRMVSGDWTGTMNLTEPQAGSDLSAVRTRAERHADHYRIFGQKIYITYGEHDLTDNIIHLVLARVTGAPAGTRGLSLFIVPKFLLNAAGESGARNEVRCASLEHKLGIHASPTAVMLYGEGSGATGYLVGEENRGLEYMFTMMNNARHAVGLEGVAIAERAYQRALSFARERVQGRPSGYAERELPSIIEHPDVKRMLLTMKSGVEAMRALAYVCGAAFDRGARENDTATAAWFRRRGDLLTPIVKGWCTEFGQELASVGVQVHGGMGFIEETGAAQYLRDARITTIYEGTTGVQAGDLVGRKTLRDGGAGARELLGEIQADANLLALLMDPRATEIAAALRASTAALERVLAWLLEHAAETALAAAGSVHYLRLWGLVAGAWQLARAAGICLDPAAGVEAEFAAAKIGTAHFFAVQILPEAESLARKIIGGSASVLAFDSRAL